MTNFRCKDCGYRYSDSDLDIKTCPRCGSSHLDFAADPKNVFSQYTDKLANVLQSKNDAYGDSFTKSIDEDGLLVLKIRLGDKFNRISSLIKKGELKENDESLEDTLLDMAGYAILGLKYLEEHKNENN